MLQSTTPSLDARLVVGNEVAAEDAFRIIDEEMKRHGDFILSLKSRRNAFAPISKLPPELLSRIFAFVREAYYSVYRERDLLSWIKVSYVCRTWRHIALNHPSLWAKLPLNHRRWTIEMLSRSKNASLTVDVDYYVLSYVTMAHQRVSLALSHSARIRHLILTNFDYSLMKKFLSDMPKQTPRLETLSLSVSRGAFDPTSEGTICELPADLISTTNHLRRLELKRFKFDWSSILSESLTQFLVHDIPSFARPTKTQFWDALKRMPLLESINLVNAFPDPASDDDTRGGILHLPHLQLITITSSTPEVESFLSRISCPPTVTINIDCRGTASTLQEFTGLFSWLSTTLSPLKKPRGFIRTLEIHQSVPRQGLRFQAYTELIRTKGEPKPVPKLDLSLSFDINLDQKPEEVFEKILADVIGATSPQGLVLLKLNDLQGRTFSARTLTETFGSLTQLRSVATSGSIAANLVKALDGTLPNKRSTRSKASRRPTFPALRSIMITNADLESDLSFSALEDMVKNRKKRGAEVRELTLEMCSRVHREDVANLEKIVPKFVWDNMEIGYSDEEYYSDGYDLLGGLYDSEMDYDDDYDFYYPF